MKWIRASDRQPADQQEVLIKIKGQVNLARYHQRENSFTLRNGICISLTDAAVEWMELIAPYKQ
jgi:hypothetical protein